MASKKVLGRGLGVYFPEYREDGQSSESKVEKSSSNSSSGNDEKIEAVKRVNIVLHVPVDHIRANPNQPRKEFGGERLDQLADSIKTHGIIQPITVRYIGEKRFELISGERRLRASKLAGLLEVPAYIREANDEQSMAFALIENIQREDLNSLEVAMAYKRLLDEFDYTQAQVAEKVGKNRSTVTNMLRLLGLPDFIQNALKNDYITMGHARALINIESENDQQQLLKKAIQQEWSVRQMEDAVRLMGTPSINKKKDSSPKADPFYDDISTRLRQTFSTKVQVKPKTKGGEIKIEYYSDDDLERILAIFDSL